MFLFLVVEIRRTWEQRLLGQRLLTQKEVLAFCLWPLSNREKKKPKKFLLFLVFPYLLLFSYHFFYNSSNISLVSVGVRVTAVNTLCIGSHFFFCRQWDMHCFTENDKTIRAALSISNRTFQSYWLLPTLWTICDCTMVLK